MLHTIQFHYSEPDQGDCGTHTSVALHNRDRETPEYVRTTDVLVNKIAQTESSKQCQRNKYVVREVQRPFATGEADK